MSSDLGRGDPGELLAQAGDDPGRLVNRERGLGDEGDVVGIVELERVDVLDRLDQDDVLRGLAGRPLDLLMALVPDQDDRVALLGELARLDVDLGHQRAGGVDRAQAARRRVRVHARGDAVGREDDQRPLGDLGLLFDEDRAALCELLDHVLVVDDLLPHVDRRAVHLERVLDRLYGAIDAGAVAARRGEQDPLRAARFGGRGHVAEGSGGGSADPRDRGERRLADRLEALRADLVERVLGRVPVGAGAGPGHTRSRSGRAPARRPRGRGRGRRRSRCGCPRTGPGCRSAAAPRPRTTRTGPGRSRPRAESAARSRRPGRRAPWRGSRPAAACPGGRRRGRRRRTGGCRGSRRARTGGCRGAPRRRTGRGRPKVPAAGAAARAPARARRRSPRRRRWRPRSRCRRRPWCRSGPRRRRCRARVRGSCRRRCATVAARRRPRPRPRAAAQRAAPRSAGLRASPPAAGRARPGPRGRRRRGLRRSRRRRPGADPPPRTMQGR